jgi:hypothetical protein
LRRVQSHELNGLVEHCLQALTLDASRPAVMRMKAQIVQVLPQLTQPVFNEVDRTAG